MSPFKAAMYTAVFLLVSHAGGSVDAYLDPGTGSIVLQAVLAAVVGALALGRMYWRRVKALILRRDVSDDILGD